MNEERIKYLIQEKKLKRRRIDKPLIQSLLLSSEENAKAAESVPLTKLTATMVFKEAYDAMRQMGDAKWLLQGYEPNGHDVSIELLMEEDDIAIKNLDMFRRIRNDANYRGYKIQLEQAKEILLFWKKHGKILLTKIKADANKV